MNKLLTINDNTRYPIDGRELHEKLGIETQYTKWLERMTEYGFAEGIDYQTILTNRSDGLPGKPRTDHHLTISMAKELCMIQRTEIGRTIRRYLIAVEDAWNSPEAVMARALKMADAEIKKLTAENSRLTVEKQIMAPKADYFDELVDRNLLTGIRETAKEFGIKQTVFIGWLISHKYVYRNRTGKLMPYAERNDGLFEMKECVNNKTKWAGTQTLITPKGRETFRLLLQGVS